MFICKECNREFENLESLGKHRARVHKRPSVQTYIDYILDGVRPLCKCGCTEPVKFLGINTGFREYAWGHASRVNNNWGHNPEAIKRSHETQKQMYSSGELQVWNKGLTMDDERVRENVKKVMSNPERGNNISKALAGKQKSEVHKTKIKEHAIKRWQNQDERHKQSQRLINNLIKNNYRNKKTKLENNFQNLLDKLGLLESVDYKYQHRISSAIFDFYFHKYNILIEVDGDFHHCNPNSIHKIPIFPIQIKTVGNDIRKNLIAEDKNIKLLRFWESDINKTPDEVIKRLKQELGL